MSGQLWFYHLERAELETALAPLLEKCLAKGWRALVRGGVAERLDALDLALWTYRDESFLPHGLDGRDDPARNPIWLMGGPGNPNGAQALFAIDGAETGDAAAFERASLLFDGRDEAAVAQARSRWKDAKATGLQVSYWRQDAAGKWRQEL